MAEEEDEGLQHVYQHTQRGKVPGDNQLDYTLVSEEPLLCQASQNLTRHDAVY